MATKINSKIIIQIAWYMSVAIFWLLDRYFKQLALNNLNSNFTCDQIICWQPSINSNLAFSLPLPLYLILFLNILIGAFLFGWYLRAKGGEKIALIAIIFGGLSNLIDRLTYQGVVDYIMIGWWPVFNLADALIVVGILWLLYLLIISDKNLKSKN
jgi:lipoprotein signal peptidase